MFKIYDEPDSPNKGGVFKICDEPESPNERACLGAGGGGGAAPPPQPPNRFLCLKPCKVPKSFWPKVLVKTHHASIGGGGCAPAQAPRCF